MKRKEYNLKELEKDAAVICRDFGIFCSYIVENKVKLAKKTGNIGKKDCFIINSFFHVREEYEKPTYFQNQYAIINFFYYIAVRYKILEINSAGTVLQQGRNYQFFCEASVWEQYMLFLAVFLFDGAYAGKGNAWYADGMTDMWQVYVDSFMEWFAMEKPHVGSRCRLSKGSRIPYFYCLASIMPYLEELNLVKVWKQPNGEGKSMEYLWEIEALPLLEMVSDLYESTDIDENADMDDGKASDSDIMVYYTYVSYIEKMVQDQEAGSLLRLFKNTSTQDQEQTIDLEVSVRYTDCIRVIRMNLKDSLYDLHQMIQKAVAFDDDHLFEFYVGSGMMKRTYTLPGVMNSGKELSVEETTLRDLELGKGQTFTYLFDFGDMWWFDIKVLEIKEGTLDEPKVIKAVNDAPKQYPSYEEEMEEWQVVITDQIQVSSILASIEDEQIREEHAALTGLKDGFAKESPDTMRREMERILLENPKRMLAFMTVEMREKLSELLQKEWVDGSEMCTFAKLYSFGFCKWLEEGQDVILVPESIKEMYSSKIKAGGKQDKIVETAEVFLLRCGVMETKLLYSAVVKFLKSKISYEDFEFLVYSRLHYFGRYYCDCYDGIEYMSCYDRELTQKILAERQKPENAVYDYPDFEKVYSEKRKETPKAMENWKEYVNFNVYVDWMTAQDLLVQIPAMAVSGVIEKEKIVATYREMLRGTGSKVTKKAEKLIIELCTAMPLATKKGNTGLKDDNKKKNESDEEAGLNKTEGKKKKEPGKEEYTQLSIFDL